MKPNKAPVPKNTHKKLPLNSRPNCERAPEEEMNSRKQKEIEDVNLNEYQQFSTVLATFVTATALREEELKKQIIRLKKQF